MVKNPTAISLSTSRNTARVPVESPEELFPTFRIYPDPLRSCKRIEKEHIHCAIHCRLDDTLAKVVSYLVGWEDLDPRSSAGGGTVGY